MLYRTFTNRSILIAKAAATMMVFIFLFLVIQQEYDNAKLRKLNNFAPRSYEYVIELMDGNKSFDRWQVEDYEHYYKMLVAYIPNRADAYGMLGFCTYHLRKSQEAIRYYQKAVELNPQFFWFHYNLGVLYLQRGEYTKAIEALKAARATQPNDTLKFLLSSKVYRPILADLADTDLPKEKLKKGFQNCFDVETAILQRNERALFLFKNSLRPQIF